MKSCHGLAPLAVNEAKLLASQREAMDGLGKLLQKLLR